MTSTEAGKSFECEKILKIFTRFCSWRKNLTMVYELVVRLWMKISYKSYGLRVALEYYSHFKKFILNFVC